MPVYQHYGLFFSAEQIEAALKNRDHEPFKSAFALLNQPPNPADVVNSAFLHALRYRVEQDLQAGAYALSELQSGVGLDGSDNHLADLLRAVALAQVFEMVRDHSEFQPNAQQNWLTRFSDFIEQLNITTSQLAPQTSGQGSRAVSHSQIVPTIWQGLVNLCAGVVLEDNRLFEAGVQTYHQTIDQEIRPEGYLPHAVEGDDGGSLERQLLSVAALTLMAEAGAQTGVDLWNYSSRGISVVTANLYCIYYYYYPDQWRWDPMTEAQSLPLYKELGGTFEMLNRHTRTNDLKLMFEALRPFYNPAAGGLTTLTHAVAGRRKLFGS